MGGAAGDTGSRTLGFIALAFSRGGGVALSLVVTAFFAAKFGAGPELDAFLAAIVVPNFLLVLLSTAVSNAFIPLFTGLREERGEEEAWRTVASTAINATVLLLLLLSLLLVALAPLIVRHVVAPGFTAAQTDLTVRLLRLFSPIIVFGGAVGLLTSFLHSYSRFVEASLYPMLGDLARVLILFALVSSLGIYVAPVSQVIGSAIGAALLAWLLFRRRPAYRATIRLADPAFRRLSRLSGYLLLAVLFNKAFPVIDRSIASTLPSGSISYLFYAFAIINVLESVFCNSVATLFFPALSSDASAGRMEEMKDSMAFMVRITAYFMIPSLVGIFILREPLVETILQRESFTAENTRLTAITMVLFLGSLVAAVFGGVFAKALYALEEMAFVLYLSIIMVLLHFGLAVGLSKAFSFFGIALVTSIRRSLNVLITWAWLRRRYGPLREWTVLRSIGLFTLCALAMGILVHILVSRLDAVLAPAGGWRSLALLITSSAAGAALYFSLTLTLKIDEAILVRDKIRAGLPGAR